MRREAAPRRSRLLHRAVHGSSPVACASRPCPQTLHKAILLVCLASLTLAGATASAQEREPIRYTLSFPAPHTHYVEVEAVVPTARKPEIELMMAVWTPGSYLVREYERHVEAVTARGADGRALVVAKTQKNRWRVATGGAAAVTVGYRVYSREMSVRTNWVERRFAMLNGAPTFLTLVESGSPAAGGSRAATATNATNARGGDTRGADARRTAARATNGRGAGPAGSASAAVTQAAAVARPHDVKLVLPADWKLTATGLPAAPGGGPHHYRADSFDTLVDSPIVAGNPSIYPFEVDGKSYALVNAGDADLWDGARAARDLEKIVRETVRLWGSAPYEKYVFLNLITEGAGGGLEHKSSTMLMTGRWSSTLPARYQGWLGTAAHELFHAWNVKRLRPIELGPFDYEHEVFTTGLWMAEGVTDYYANVIVRRAGLTDDVGYLNDTSDLIRSLQTTPGRLVTPVEQASRDAWIRQYRPDENSPNVAISYYTKGAVIGFLLDAKIRKATGGAKSLDDVMRLAYERFSGPRGFTEQDFRGTVRDVAGTDFGDWWTRVLQSTEELDYTEALDWFGLRFRPAMQSGRATLGLVTRADNGRLLVTQVRRGTPAYDAGFNVDDEIVAIDEIRVRADQWNASMDRYRPGQAVSVLVARRDRLERLDATFGADPGDPWRLELRPDATADQQRHLRQYLTSAQLVTSP